MSTLTSYKDGSLGVGPNMSAFQDGSLGSYVPTNFVAKPRRTLAINGLGEIGMGEGIALVVLGLAAAVGATVYFATKAGQKS